MIRRLIFLSLVLLLAGTAPALAEKNSGEGYAVPSYKELIQTFVLLDGLNINDPNVADEYAQLIHCSLYRASYKNDVEWNKIRQMLIARVAEKREVPRVFYQASGIFKLERYEFEKQQFPLSQGTALNNVGSIVLTDDRDFRTYCNKIKPSPLFPVVINLVLSQPLTLNRFKIPVEEVEKILARMGETKNPDRYVYARLRFHLTDAIKPVASRNAATRIELRGEISTIDFYLDKELTKPIGTTQLRREDDRKPAPPMGLPK